MSIEVYLMSTKRREFGIFGLNNPGDSRNKSNEVKYKGGTVLN